MSTTVTKEFVVRVRSDGYDAAYEIGSVATLPAQVCLQDVQEGSCTSDKLRLHLEGTLKNYILKVLRDMDRQIKQGE